jgi:hypothetical protein
MTGGAGADTFVISAGFNNGNEIITGFEVGTDKLPLVDFHDRGWFGNPYRNDNFIRIGGGFPHSQWIAHCGRIPSTRLVVFSRWASLEACKVQQIWGR